MNNQTYLEPVEAHFAAAKFSQAIGGRSREGFTGLSPIIVAHKSSGLVLTHHEFEGRTLHINAHPIGAER